MRTKEEVKTLILKYCDKYNFEKPKNWNRKEVENIIEKTKEHRKTHCTYCNKYNEAGFEAPCMCEIDSLKDNFL